MLTFVLPNVIQQDYMLAFVENFTIDYLEAFSEEGGEQQVLSRWNRMFKICQVGDRVLSDV